MSWNSFREEDVERIQIAELMYCSRKDATSRSGYRRSVECSLIACKFIEIAETWIELSEAGAKHVEWHEGGMEL